MTESNIQDYISNIVSKYLPAGLSPWQICVIPVIRTIQLPRSDETAGPSTSTEITSENGVEDELSQAQQHSMSNDQPTVCNIGCYIKAIQLFFFYHFFLLWSFLSHPYSCRFLISGVFLSLFIELYACINFVLTSFHSFYSVAAAWVAVIHCRCTLHPAIIINVNADKNCINLTMN